MLTMPSVGDAVVLTLPNVDDVRYWRRCGFRKRSLSVESVRDLYEKPLALSKFLKHPFRLLSRWQLRAVDTGTGKRVKFCLGSSVEFRSSGEVRVGLYEQNERRPSKIYGPGFDATLSDRRLLQKFTRQISEIDFDTARLCVFAADLRLRRLAS